MHNNQLVEIITEIIKQQLASTDLGVNTEKHDNSIPIGISNRHVHLSDHDLERLFGPGANMTVFKELSQPGQYAAEQLVTLVGPKGVIESVRVLGPTRKATQVEISVTDCFKLGIKAPIRDSGDLKGSAKITLVGPAGSVTIEEGCIIAARHIHMHTTDAIRFGVKDGDRVTVKAPGPRGVMFFEVLVRVSDKYKLEMHVDVDEANAACLRNNDSVEVTLN